jgi:hypothetical protein
MLSRLNLAVNENQGWMDRFGITLHTDDLEVLVLGANNNTRVIAWYNGSGAITLSDYANLPLGSIIFDLQAHTTVEKAAAAGTSTWKTSAARS